MGLFASNVGKCGKTFSIMGAPLERLILTSKSISHYLTWHTIGLGQVLKWADIVRLAYQDNENDEYHAPVSIVDVWANYAALAGQGWTQQAIGEAVNCPQSTVSERVKFNGLNDDIKSFIAQGFLLERHLREILTLSLGRYFTQWFTMRPCQLLTCGLITPK